MEPQETQAPETPQTKEEPIPSTEENKEAEQSEQPQAVPGAKTEGKMKAAYLEAFGEPPVIKEIPIPTPGSGEVLIKVEAAPINPSDLGYLKKGPYNKATLPYRLGFEGSGTVISSGGGLFARTLVGKRVAFGGKQGGTWGEYVVTDAMACVTIDKEVTFEQAACGVVNPFTAIAFLEIMKKDKIKAVVQQAAASQLGRMLIKLLKKEGIKTINIVRREEQKKLLEGLGADVVINSQDKDFEDQLKKKAQELQATCLLECVCGKETAKTIRAMPRDSECYIYGHLDSEALTDVDLQDLLMNNKTIKPFYLPVWMDKQWLLTKVGVMRKVQKLISGDLKSEISKRFGLEEINEALDYYKNNMTEGKVIIKPSPENKSN